MSFFDELKNSFYSEQNPLVKKLRDQIRDVSFSGSIMHICLKSSDYGFFLSANNENITKFLSTVFETDNISNTSCWTESSQSSVSWYRIVDFRSDFTKEIIVYWRI